MPIKSNIHAIKNAPSQITAGFILILTLIISLLVLWVNNTSENKNLMLEMAGESVESHRITKMMNAVHMQAMAIHELKLATAPQEKAEAYLQFKTHGATFSSVSHLLLSNPMEDAEQKIWSKISNHLKETETTAAQAETFFSDNQQEKAYQLLIGESDLFEHHLMESVSKLLSNELLKASQGEINHLFSELTKKNKTTNLLLFLLGGIALLLGGFMLFILKQAANTETATVEQGERLRDLYEATSISGISLDEKIDETLRLGCRVLGMEVGKLGHQDPEMNTSTFMNTIAPEELPAKRGLVLPLDKTFCQLTFSSDGPIAIHHVSKSKYKDLPAASFLGMEAYIGTTIFVNDEKFGTVNFSNRKPRSKPFTNIDKDFVNLLGKWISITMEQQISEQALQNAKDEAETANHAKSTFLANMSHEIRTPLTAILGYSEMLLEDDDKSEEEKKHEITSIAKSGSHLHDIINDILDLSKIEAGQLVISNIKCEITEILNEVEFIFKPKANKKGLSFNTNLTYPLPEIIITDPTRLKQILINLCGNAIKFTKKGGVTINAGFLEDENQLVISVTDTGIGITEQAQQYIFNPFSQADDSISRRFGGTGLGLCISKQLSQKLGGDITVESTRDEGTIFTAFIDVGMPNNKLEMIHEIVKSIDNEPKPALYPQKFSGHILLAEDNPSNQHLISKYIQKTGLTIDIVANGKQALEHVKKCKYDLILMDMQMPVMDGIEATKQLRQSGLSIPIICITANAMRKDMERCFEAGMDEYLTKPLDFSHFNYVLSQFLKGNASDSETPDSNPANFNLRENQN